MFGHRKEPKPEPHRCEEFTRWRKCSSRCKRAPTEAEIAAGITGWVDNCIQYWQERECTTCGKVEQLPLNYGNPPEQEPQESFEDEEEESDE